jgi:hypothetical protein
MKLEFSTQGPNSWASTYQVWPLIPICQIKTDGEEQRKEIYYMARDIPQKRQSKHSAYL